ncbi:ATP-binding protein [Wenxinia saemankumensis]|uniref:histidine kinase n=1 Tax=Wenxinia saemankumensis TaxID=1447782 RepID=A0A1M5ZYR6_9RHOB|nr:ATP-binding protein [Wenxinia saemankumensis]SHI29404.1 CHASE domain-containing protein [Wenxinia saemankumensis]
MLRKRVVESTVGSVLAVLLTLAIAASALKLSQTLHADRINDLRLTVTLETVELRERVEAEIDAVVSSLLQLGTALRLDPDMTQAEYEIVAETIVRDNPSILNLAAARDLRLSLAYPYEPNRTILGFDLRDYPDQLAGVARAIRTGKVVVDGPVELVQGGIGSIGRYPVTTIDAAGEERLWGVASVVFDHSAAIASAIGDVVPSGLLVAVTSQGPRDGALHVLFGDAGVAASQDPVELGFDFVGGNWSFFAAPAGGWPQNALTHPHNVAIAALALLAIAAIWILQIIMRNWDKAELQLLRAVEAINGGFAMFDAGGRLLAYNAAYTQMYDRCRGAIRRGARFEDILRAGLRNGQYPDAVGREDEWLEERLALHAHPAGEFDQRLSNGRWVRISEQRAEDGVLVSIRVDVTELKEAQAAAEAANRAKTEFLNVLSHELRTPLTVINGYARLVGTPGAMPDSRRLASVMDEAPDDPAALREAVESREGSIRRTMETIRKSADHLLYLVEEMLDFGKVEAGKLTVEPEICEVSGLVDAAVEQCRGRAEGKGITLEVDAAEARVMADPKRTHQILLNLIGNAVKFTEAGSVRVSVLPRDNVVEIAVTDSGPGIAASELESIFKPFYQVDSSSVRRAGGTGLGLAIARDLAGLQGGAIGVESELGAGSRFTLSLPRSRKGEMRLAGE